jgi:hypothetical protein
VTGEAPIARFLAALPHPAQQNGRGWQGRCPGHEDDRASLSIGTGDDGRVLLKCHAGCAAAAIVSAVGLEMRDLFSAQESHAPDAVFDYRDESGGLLFQVCRFPGKQFRQRRPDGGGGWLWSLGDVRRVLYRLPDLKGHPAVFICEGEKDTDRLAALGLPATTNPHGAGKWRPDFAAQLAAAGVQRVAILPDHDPPGEAHARAVARSCHEAGLAVKIVALPGLPPKGDVSDFLANHDKAAFLAIVKDALPYDPLQSVTAPIAGTAFSLTSIGDLLAEPDELVDWLVQDRIPAGSIALLAGPPKSGKSTAARAMVYAVAAGEPWLGWRTAYGPVWLVSLEEKRSEVRRHFRQMGATGREPIHFFIDQASTDLIPQMHALAATERPMLIVVDTLQRLIRAKDLSDYAEVTERFNPLLKLARDTGASLLLVHHTNKTGEGLNSVLGSTALAGSVDNVFLLQRTDQRRTLSSIQRIGPDLEPVVVELNELTGHLSVVGTKRDSDEAAAAQRILDALRDQPPVTEGWIKAHVDGRWQDATRGLRLLLRQGRATRSGRGGKSDAYRYQTADSSSLVPEVPGIILVPDVRTSTRELGTLSSTTQHSSSLVPQVPENLEIFDFDTHETAKPPNETGSDSSSHEPPYPPEWDSEGPS